MAEQKKDKSREGPGAPPIDPGSRPGPAGPKPNQSREGPGAPPIDPGSRPGPGGPKKS